MSAVDKKPKVLESRVQLFLMMEAGTVFEALDSYPKVTRFVAR
jgi:hypothetical protein